MVMAAGGAGSSLVIKGTINTSDIDRGFARINLAFDNVKGQANSFNSDLTRMVTTTRDLAGGLGKVAIAGTAALVGLAKGAPAVAPALARISVQAERLQRNIGRVLQPTFETLADTFEKFVGFAGRHPDFLKGFVFTGAALAGIKALGLLFGVTVSPTVLVALGLLAAAGVGIEALNKQSAGLKETFGIAETPATELLKTSPIGGLTPLTESLEVIFIVAKKLIGLQSDINKLIDERGGDTEKDRKFDIMTWWDSVWG